MGGAIQFPSVVLIAIAVMACITRVPGKKVLIQIRGSNFTVSCSSLCNSMYVDYYVEESFPALARNSRFVTLRGGAERICGLSYVIPKTAHIKLSC